MRRPRPPATLVALAFAAVAGCASPAAERAAPPGPRARGSLCVASVPAGARILIDGASTPYRTPTTIPDLAAGDRRLLLTLAGHRNWNGVATVPPGDVARLTVRLQAAATGSLAIASIPAGAAVSVDGAARGTTPLALEGLAVGTSALQVRRDGYEPWSQAVVILPGRRLEVEAVLTPSPHDLGSLSVQSQPPRARVSLDGYPTGLVTPATLHGIPAGRHRVEVLLDGHLPWHGEVTVREEQSAGLLVTLLAAEAGDGALRVESEPPGAAIAVDGRAAGLLAPALVPQLAAGSHRVELTLEGHRTWSGTVRVTAGATGTVRAQLAPLP